MPVLAHEVSDKVREKDGAVYGCWNREEFSETYVAQTRRYRNNGDWDLRQVFVPHLMSTDCRYDMSLTDIKCEGCQHRGSGEAYDAMIRSQGS